MRAAREKFDIRAALAKFARGLLEPPPELLVYEWAQKNIVLTEKESPGCPGPYNTDRTPYVREPLQCFADKSVSSAALCFGTQTSKTLTMLVGICYRLVNDPANCLWVVPNEKPFGLWFSNSRWFPMLEACKPLAAMRPPAGLAKTLWKKLEQQFPKATMSFVGSHSAANLAGRPVGILAMDEVDKFPEANDKEPGATDNAEERTKTISFAFHVTTSTPTRKDKQIWQEFLRGDQRYYFVPCPHCQVKIRLEWKQVKHFDEEESDAMTDGVLDMAKVRRLAHYRCQECDGKIYDHHKPEMLKAGEWRPTNVDKNGRVKSAEGVRSYHLNSLYAPWESCALGRMAVKWLEVKDNPKKRQKFVNSTLALPWDAEMAYDDEPIATCDYSIAEMIRTRVPVCSVDVQDDHFWVLVRAWAPDGESWLLHEEKVFDIEDIERIQKKYNVKSSRVVLDMADRPSRVARWIAPRGWRGIAGVPNKKSFNHMLNSGIRVEKLYSEPKARDPHLGTDRQGSGRMPAIYMQFAKNPTLDVLTELRSGKIVSWNIHPNVSPEYVKHINAGVKLVEKLKDGTEREFWMMKREDHLLDCECMNLVAAMASGLITDAPENIQGMIETYQRGQVQIAA